MNTFYKLSLHLILLLVLALQAGCASSEGQMKTTTPVSPTPQSITPTQLTETVPPAPTISPVASVTINQPTLPSASTLTPVTQYFTPGQQGIGFGAYLDVHSPDKGLGLMEAAGSNWVHIPFYWSTVELQENQINWGPVYSLENELRTAANNHLNIILYINDTPVWALKKGFTCGAVAQDKFAALANFLGAMVQRYSVAPFNVKYFELWSEPDTSKALGCWGDPSDPQYYGGAYYGEMLKIAYPAIKAANLQAQVLFGGLLMDCDADHIDLCTESGSETAKLSIARFFEGALIDGAGSDFDGVSFHAYDFSLFTGNPPLSALGQYGNVNWNTSWDTTGPVVLAKAAYLREVLARYNITGKYLMNTEVAMLCGRTGQEPACTTADHAATQSAYIVQVYASGLASGLPIMIWFSAAGWRGSALFDTQLAPLPARTAFKYASDRLSNATFVKPITDFPGVKGYEFTQDGHRMWVLWSVTAAGNPHLITPGNETVSQVFDMYGSSLGSGATLSVGLEPVYVELSS